MKTAFGKFPSFEDFLDSYKAARRKTFADSIEGMSLGEQMDRIRDRRDRDVVEIASTLRVRQDDDTEGGGHYHLLVNVTDILETDPDVNEDVQTCMEGARDVFVAIRFGDGMGIQEPIEGLDPGKSLHIRGEWIPAEKAYSHGGEKLSVLHFTHHPLGFICVEEHCYS